MNPMMRVHIVMNDAHDELELLRIDVNLLVAFDTLARERSVTRAAERSGVTQSAMSHTLRRLRDMLGDPLLVRGRGGMVLTPRAQALVVPLRAGLRSLARALAEPEPFDPAQAHRCFRIASPDLFDILATPALLQHLQQHAPGIDLALVPRPADLGQALETGELDLAIEPVLLDEQPFTRGPALGSELRQRTLFRDSMRCFVRAGHPLAGRRRISVKAYAELDHLLVSPTGEGAGLVDRYLREQGLSRRIVLRVPHFSSALAILATTDLVLTAPRSLGRSPLVDDVVDFAVPLALPEHAIAMVWHPRYAEDPGHRWFRDTMLQVTRPMATP